MSNDSRVDGSVDGEEYWRGKEKGAGAGREGGGRKDGTVIRLEAHEHSEVRERRLWVVETSPVSGDVVPARTEERDNFPTFTSRKQIVYVVLKVCGLHWPAFEMPVHSQS